VIFDPVTEHHLRARRSEKRYSSGHNTEEGGILGVVRNAAERLLKGE